VVEVEGETVVIVDQQQHGGTGISQGRHCRQNGANGNCAISGLPAGSWVAGSEKLPFQ